VSQSQEKEFRVALYSRVSTDEQREGQTIQSQIAELERFVNSKGWSVAATYQDDGWSGAILARPSLDRLRDDCAAGLFDAVVINDVDRLARDVSHLGIVKRDLERKNIQLIFRKLPQGSSPTNNLMINILGSFAEFDREQIIDRTRRGRRHKIEVRKEYVGCTAPYGYYYRALSGQKGGKPDLQIVPAQADVVRRMFDWVVNDGLSLRRIAKRLDEAGVPPPKGGMRWNICSIGRMLHNETYAGVWSYGKAEPCEPTFRRSANPYRRRIKTGRRRRPRSEWLQVQLPKALAIVSPQRWLAAQQRIAQNPQFSPRNTKHEYLLQGLVRCDYCSWLVGVQTCRASGRKYFYYQCHHPHCLRNRWHSRDSLEAPIWRLVRTVLLDPKKFLQRSRKAVDRLRANAKPSAEEQALKEQIQRNDRSEIIALDAYRAGRLSPNALAAELERLRANSASLKERLADTTPTPMDGLAASDEEICRRVAGSLENGDFELRRDILRRVIAKARLARESARVTVRLPLDDDSVCSMQSPSPLELPPSRGCKRNRGIEIEIEIPLATKRIRRKTELAAAA